MDDEEDDWEMELELHYSTAQAWLERAAEAKKKNSNFDEVSYVESAIEAFKEALLYENDANNKNKLSQQIKELETRVNSLGKMVSKLPEVDELVDRAMRLDKDGSNDKEAQALYRRAAQGYQQALKRPSVLKYQERKWRSLHQQTLARAEDLKKRAVGKEFAQSTAEALADSSNEKYTREEKRVLLESSKINGVLMQPWEIATQESWKFTFPEPFRDPDGKIPLSQSQRERCQGWARPRQMMERTPCILSKTPSPLDVIQDSVTDCSFLSSLAIAAHHEWKWGKRLISGIIFPQDSNGWPAYNPDGKYIIKLWWNGTARQVIIDDFFPVTEQREWLCSHSRRKNELWVSLIEKAYMKLNGGYNFPGSVSGIDVYALTGWIPEAHTLSSLAAESKEFAWNKCISASRLGDVLMTISTSDFDDEVADQVGLVSLHAYAILNVRELADGTRLLLLKNPWRRVRWKGHFSPWDDENWTPERLAEVGYRLEKAKQTDDGVFYIDFDSLLDFFHILYLNWNPDLFKHKLFLHRSWPSSVNEPDDALTVARNPQFQLLIDDVRSSEHKMGSDTHVYSLPEAPSHQVSHQRSFGRKDYAANDSDEESDAHSSSRARHLSGTRNLDADQAAIGMLNKHAQVVDLGQSESGETTTVRPDQVASTDKVGLVWILLTRHVVHNTELLRQDPGSFMALNVYDRRHGTRVYYPENPLIRGTYTNNPHNLISLSVGPGQHAYTLVVSLYEKLRSMNYTLVVYASEHCVNPVLRALPMSMQYSKEIDGVWKRHSAGGCPKYPTYMLNPQYSITFEEDCEMLHLHMFANKEYPVNIRLFNKPTGQRRVDSPDPRTLVASSGAYRKGFCMLEQHNLKAGTPYTIVVSTFLPSQLGSFLLHTEADVPFHVEPVANEAEHLDYRQVIPGSWSTEDGTDGGCPNFGTYAYNPIVRIHCEAPSTELLVRLRYLPETEDATCSEWPSLNVSIFSQPVSSRQAQDAIYVSNGGIYTNPPCGTLIEECQLKRGTYYLVPSTFEPMEGDYMLVLYSSQPIEAFYEPSRGPPPPGLRKPVPPKPPKPGAEAYPISNDNVENTMNGADGDGNNGDNFDPSAPAPAYPLEPSEDSTPSYVSVAKDLLASMNAEEAQKQDSVCETTQPRNLTHL